MGHQESIAVSSDNCLRPISVFGSKSDNQGIQ